MSKSINNVFFTPACAALALTLSLPATAGLDDLAGSFQTELEELAAAANQRVYDRLLRQGCVDSEPSGEGEEPPLQGEFCTGQTLAVFNNVRELVHTANELTGSGPTRFSLGGDLESLGFALRWTAAEEFAAQGSMSSSFVNGQLAGLASRITALRRGSRGFVMSFGAGEELQLAGRGRRLGGGAGADDAGSGDLNDQWSKWGGFINGSYLFGEKESTELEPAFDFDGREINGGIDYRLDPNWVVGLVFGYQQQETDFDDNPMVVDANIDTDGFSLMPFALYQSDDWFFSGSLGYQSLEFDTERSVRYPSLNPGVESVNTVANSSTDSDVVSVYATAGYTWRLQQQFRLEPYLSLEYQDITVDDYRERDLFNDGFDFLVPEQNIESFETVLGLKAHYVSSVSWGVINPFVDVQWRGQQQDDSRNIRALYASAAGLTEAESFVIPTDELDSQYFIYTVGVAAVLRGAAQSGFGGPASGGIQAFINWRFIESLDDYDQDVISFGVRYEF